MASTYEAIATNTLGSTTASVTFSSIPATYTDLILVSSIVTPSGGGNTSAYKLQVGNGSVDTGSNYSFTRIYGDGSSAVSDRLSSTTDLAGAFSFGSSTNPNIITQFSNYANTSVNKTTLTRLNTASAFVVAFVSLWRSTSAINTITISNGILTGFAAGSTFTLYGIKSA
jgi:hypothetical protein